MGEAWLGRGRSGWEKASRLLVRTGAQYVRHMNYLSQMGPWARDHGDRHPGAALLLCLLVAGLVVVSVMLYRSRRAVPVALGAPSPSLNAQAILAERLARGEVSVEDFSAARGALRGDSRPAVGLKDV